jgi:hypothetical protein
VSAPFEQDQELSGFFRFEPWLLEWFEQTGLQIEVPLIIIHKIDQPDVVVNLLNTDRLAGEDLAEVNFLSAQTDAAAAGEAGIFRSAGERMADLHLGAGMVKQKLLLKLQL